MPDEPMVIPADQILDILTKGQASAGPGGTKGVVQVQPLYGSQTATGAGGWIVVTENTWSGDSRYYGAYLTQQAAFEKVRSIYADSWTEPECEEYELDDHGDETEECLDYSHTYTAPHEVHLSDLDSMNEYLDDRESIILRIVELEQ